MENLFHDANDRLKTLITGLKSPQSVAQAFKQYLNDKTTIAAKQISMVAETIAIDTDSMTESQVSQKIDEIIDSAGARTTSVIIGPDGNFYKLKDVLTSVLLMDGETDPLLGNAQGLQQLNVSSIIDSMVDSFQSAKIFESAFSVISTTEERAYSSIADIDARLRAMGLELTSRASQTLVAVGDIMSDINTGVIQKISSLSRLLVKGSESIDSSTTGINLPDIDQSNYEGASPFSAMLQDIHIDFTDPIEAVVSYYKAVATITVKVFAGIGIGISKGWNWLTRKVDQIVRNPVDFYEVNKSSASHIVDVPFYDETTAIPSIFIPGQTTYVDAITSALYDMEIGSLRVCYTPFSVFTLYKVSAGYIRVIGHLIPSNPFSKETTEDSDFAKSINATYLINTANCITDNFHEGIDCSVTTVFDRFIYHQPYADFQPSVDDDAYYLSSLAASMMRTHIILNLASAAINAASLQDYNKDLQGYTWSQIFDDPSIMDGTWYGSTWYSTVTGAVNVGPGGVVDHFGFLKLWSDVSDYHFFIDALRGYFSSDDVTNATFIRLLNYPKGDTAMGLVLLLMHLNQFNVMEACQNQYGDVPAFIPALFENEYPVPRYAIATDSKNGSSLAKLFVGILVGAVVVTAAVCLPIAAVAIKRSMNMALLRLNGLQRAIENMDPSDPEYFSRYKSFRKAKRQFAMKNKFLSLIGMGISKTASNTMKGTGLIESFADGTADILKTDLSPIIDLII